MSRINFFYSDNFGWNGPVLFCFQVFLQEKIAKMPDCKQNLVSNKKSARSVRAKTKLLEALHEETIDLKSFSYFRFNLQGNLLEIYWTAGRTTV